MKTSIVHEVKCLTESFVQMRWPMKAKEEKEQAPGILVSRVKPTLDHIITQNLALPLPKV